MQHYKMDYSEMKKRPNTRQTSFGYRFAMLHRLQMSMCRKDMQQAGIQPSQFPFLAKLVREESPVTQDYLSSCLAIDKGTTARAISHLERAGYVTRETNPENRRQNLVSATEKAHAVTNRLFIILNDVSKIFVQGFTKEERNIILNLMDRMISNAQKERNECSNQAG
jgi:DNA-binding MarR family transcriptional regulator